MSRKGAAMYIDYTINIDFIEKLPPDYVNLLKEAEEYDKEENEPMYDNCVEAIDNGAKLMCDGGRINAQQWEQLMRRYR